jgi:hypothetical protein
MEEQPIQELLTQLAQENIYNVHSLLPVVLNSCPTGYEWIFSHRQPGGIAKVGLTPLSGSVFVAVKGALENRPTAMSFYSNRQTQEFFSGG